MKKGLILLAASSLLALTACSDSVPKAQEAEAIDTRPNLREMTLQQAIATKYDYATLSCKFWSRQNQAISASSTPDRVVSIDLLKDSSVPQVISVTDSKGSSIVQTNIRLDFIQLYNVTLTTADKATYELKDALNIGFSVKSGVMVQNGEIATTLEQSGWVTGENIPNNIIASSMKMGDNPTQVDLVQCSIDAVLKDSYKRDHKLKSPGIVEDCYFKSTPIEKCMIRR